MHSKHFELVSNPLYEINPTVVNQPLYDLLVTYIRSAEALSLNEYNQDAFAVWSNNNRFVATIADGVGQSFRGDIAAMAIVQVISRVLWEHDINNQLNQVLSAELTALSPKVQELLAAIDISHHPVMFRDALALRRQLGSESVFAACAIDWISESVYLCWLGDCRIRLYNRDYEPVIFDQKLFRTSERWSSQRTLVGDLHSMKLPLQSVQRIVLYSDGLQILDNTSLDTAQLQDIVGDAVSKSLKLPESDDITLIAYDTTKAI